MTSKKTTKSRKSAQNAITLDADLTPRQNAFVFWYTTAGDTFYNATQAAKTAGYKGKDNVLAVTGWDNLRKPKIARAIRARQRELFSAADVSVDKVLMDIELVRQMAVRDGNHLAALKASELHGKHLKMFADKIEHLHTIDDVSTDALVELAQSLMGKIDGFSNALSPRRDGPSQSVDAGAARDKTTH